MPLPATRHALPHVGAAGAKRPDRTACADPQVGGLLRGGQRRHWQTGNALRAEIQRRIFPALLATAAQASLPRQMLGAGAGQRQVPPRPRTRALAEPAPRATHAIVLATIQSRAQSRRTRMETRAPLGNPQSALPDTGRHHGCRERALWTLGKIESAIGKTMRHYLRRCV